MSNIKKENIIVTLLLFVLLLVLSAPLPGYRGDMSCFLRWTNYIHINGLRQAYNGDTDYMPVYQYCLWVFGKLGGTAENIEKHFGYVRVFTLIAEFLGIYLIYKWANRSTNYRTALLFTMLNIAYIFNTVFWGQVDAILATLVFLSFYLLYNLKPVLSTIFMLIAINMKMQALAFVPLWGILLLYYIISSRRFSLLAILPLAMLIMEFLIIFPFGKSGAQRILDIASGYVGLDPLIVQSADNIWILLLGLEKAYTPDTALLYGFTYRTWGLLLFFISSGFAMWPVCRYAFSHLRHQQGVNMPPKELIWLAGGLISLLFFFCNTEMHERYCHPAFIFITAFAFSQKKYAAYVIFSVAYFLNLEWVIKFFRLANYGTLVFDQRFVASLFLIVIILLYIYLYRYAKSPAKPVLQESPLSIAGA